LKHFLYISFVFWCNLFIAQNSLSPQVIGSQGSTLNSSSGNSVQYTVGEAIIITTQSSNHILTQGFNQPKTSIDNNLLVVFYTVTPANCFGIYNGSILIDSIAGCDGNYAVNFNGVNTSNYLLDSLTSRSYTLIVTSGDGCEWIEDIVIPATGVDCELIFYNAFSPNDDGMNDVWLIQHAEAYPGNMLQIFDRWGNAIATIEDYNNDDRVWDGKNKNGVLMPNGTYFYIFQSGEALFKGYVEITR
jgi:gliding motility-associated-like protein